jgi:hypothetical protein
VRENRAAALLEGFGYTCFTSRGSRGIDLLAVADHGPHLAVEVGGPKKVLAESFASLYAAKKPAGTRVLVVRWIKPRGKRAHFRWHLSADPGDFYDDLADALEALSGALHGDCPGHARPLRKRPWLSPSEL